LGLGTACWHNNHHAYPDSARHGHTTGQLDPSWWVIVVSQALGLAREVAVPENLPERTEVEILEMG